MEAKINKLIKTKSKASKKFQKYIENIEKPQIHLIIKIIYKTKITKMWNDPMLPSSRPVEKWQKPLGVEKDFIRNTTCKRKYMKKEIKYSKSNKANKIDKKLGPKTINM